MALVGLSGIENQNDQIGAIDWSNLLNTVLEQAPKIIDATSNKGGYNVYSGGQGMQIPPVQSKNTGLSTQTMLLVGAGALALILLLRK